jgi:hypothetical protein
MNQNINRALKIVKAGLKEGYTHEDYQKKIEQAEDCVKKALSKTPISRNLLLEAIDLYSEAMNMNSSKAEPYLAVAYISWKFMLFDEAVMLLKTALKLSPGNIKGQEMLSEIEKEYIKTDTAQQVKDASRKALSEKIKNMGNINSLLNKKFK